MFVVPPKQGIVPGMADAVSRDGSEIVAVAVVWHPNASITEMLYVPAARLLKLPLA